MALLAQYVVGGIAAGSLYALVALGIVLLYRTSRVLNFAHGDLATFGTFLAFADPAVRIPPGQSVRLSTPAGAKVKGRIFYLVPIQPSVVIVPMNSVMLVGFRTEDFGPRLTLTVVGVPAPNVIVSFSVRL